VVRSRRPVPILLSRRNALAATLLLAAIAPRASNAQSGLLGGEFQVNAYTPNRQTMPDVDMRGDGQFVIVWHGGSAQDGNAYGVFARRFTALGAPVAIEFQVNTYTSGSQSYPRVALTGSGSFMVVWDSFVTNQDGAGHGVFARLFNSSGAAVAVEFQVNTYTIGDQQRPDVDSDAEGDFTVVWHGPGALATGVIGQRFDSSGARQGEEFKVHTYPDVFAANASIAASPDGAFVVVWTNGAGQDGSVTGIFGQRFDQEAVKLGSDFQVNTATSGHQNLPRVDTDADGDFTVVWNGIDSSSGGVMLQRYDSAGVRVGGELLVNSFFTGSQFGGDIGVADDGEFVIAWQSQGNDGNSYGIFAQLFDSSGAKSGGEFQVNKYTPTSQVNPSAAMDDDGDFIISWMSPRPGDTGDVLATRGGEPPVLAPGDIDGSGTGDALTDGLLILRYLFGFSGAPLTTGATAAGCTRCDETSITAALAAIYPTAIDVDGNGNPDALTDGLLVLRYLFGFTGTTLTTGATGAGCSRCDSTTIVPYLEGLFVL
jgi:hypothetical protein